MKLTKKSYDKAKADLPKLRKAEETVRQWDEAIASLGQAIAGVDVTEIEIGGLFPSFTGRRKEVDGASSEAGRGAA